MLTSYFLLNWDTSPEVALTAILIIPQDLKSKTFYCDLALSFQALIKV